MARHTAEATPPSCNKVRHGKCTVVCMRGPPGARPSPCKRKHMQAMMTHPGRHVLLAQLADGHVPLGQERHLLKHARHAGADRRPGARAHALQQAHGLGLRWVQLQLKLLICGKAFLVAGQCTVFSTLCVTLACLPRAGRHGGGCGDGCGVHRDALSLCTLCAGGDGTRGCASTPCNPFPCFAAGACGSTSCALRTCALSSCSPAAALACRLLPSSCSALGLCAIGAPSFCSCLVCCCNRSMSGSRARGAVEHGRRRLCGAALHTGGPSYSRRGQRTARASQLRLHAPAQ